MIISINCKESCDFQKVGQKLNCDEILNHSERLHRQQKVVSKKVLSQILTNQRACNEEFERYLYDAFVF